VLVGVNVTFNFCCPGLNTVPPFGEYVNVPATVDVASSCVALSAVPYAIAAGVAHVIVGVALFTVRVTLAVAAL
jgi:hypothetical protein